MSNQIQSNPLATITEDEFVDARDSWDNIKSEGVSSKAKTPEIQTKSFPKSPKAKAKLPLFVPKNVMEKLSFPLDETMKTIKVLDEDSFSQGSGDWSSAEHSFKKSASLPNEHSREELENSAKSCCAKKNSVDKSYKKAKTLELNTKKIDTKKEKKRTSEFDNLCLQQDMKVSDKSIWSSHFNPDGSFFATGGADHIVRVWEVNDFSEEGRF